MSTLAKLKVRGGLTFLVILTLTALFFATGPRFYNGLNKGVAWDWGGVELVGEPGLFICDGGQPYPAIKQMLPGLVVDC